MNPTVLVTGGAGFIGSHVVDQLLEEGYDVTVYDKLVEQVHENAGPRYLAPEANFIHGDMRDRDALEGALAGVEAVIHLAAEVGVGQSMYEISRYVDANTSGTATLLDILANDVARVERIVVASSMSVYGEGAYLCAEHGIVFPPSRDPARLAQQIWEPACPTCGAELSSTGTPESKPLQPGSVYAISKMDQELLCLVAGGAYGMGVVALRYFNAYGPRQALANPYTGVGAIFSARLLAAEAPLAFEDGLQLRDFIHVRDVARATVSALRTPAAYGHAINIGVGRPMTILEIAGTLARALDVEIAPEATGKYRAGDIRHCYADMSKAEELLGFAPAIPFEDGVQDLISWVARQPASAGLDEARVELERRGLAR
ncbi:MAG: SDR family NAD(P)-dependent oxidoreductase [Solirubrobacteraceae bacterium]